MAIKEVGLLKLVEPEYLSLVGSPANRTGFKIIRSKQEEGNMSHTDRNLRVRSKVKRADGLLSIDFPEGISNEEAEEFMDSFALGEDYELVVNDSGNYYAKRTGDNLDDPVVPIELGNGFTANISTVTMASRSDSKITGVTLVGLEFDETFSDVASVESWLGERDVNYKTDGIESVEGGTIVTRHDVPEGNEIRKIRLGDGVTGMVSKTKDDDIPTKVYRSVIEQAYGNWGWGHLNFATALADPTFTDASWDAIFVLRDVLENVVLYSGLPLDDRKVLIQNVCDEFTQYMTSLIDSLPREVIEQARADRKSIKEPDDMAIAKKGNKKVVRKDTEADAKDIDETTEDVSRDDAEDTDDKKDYVTRGDLEDVVTKAVAAAMKPAEDAKVERTDEEDTGESTSETGGSDNAMATAMATMAAAVTTMGETMATITRSVDDMKGDIDELGGDTVSRSDDDEADATDEEDLDVAKAKREDASPFDGMFGDRFK